MIMTFGYFIAYISANGFWFAACAKRNYQLSFENGTDKTIWSKLSIVITKVIIHASAYAYIYALTIDNCSYHRHAFAWCVRPKVL